MWSVRNECVEVHFLYMNNSKKLKLVRMSASLHDVLNDIIILNVVFVNS